MLSAISKSNKQHFKRPFVQKKVVSKKKTFHIKVSLKFRGLRYSDILRFSATHSIDPDVVYLNFKSSTIHVTYDRMS